MRDCAYICVRVRVDKRVGVRRFTCFITGLRYLHTTAKRDKQRLSVHLDCRGTHRHPGVRTHDIATTSVRISWSRLPTDGHGNDQVRFLSSMTVKVAAGRARTPYRYMYSDALDSRQRDGIADNDNGNINCPLHYRSQTLRNCCSTQHAGCVAFIFIVYIHS
jgi:hypothetical protein